MAETLRDALRGRDLLPHQVEFIETALDSESRGRLVLADDVGLGKTRACVALVWAWAQSHSTVPRTLILAPRALLPQWQAELAEFAAVDAAIVDASHFRHLEARTPPEENPWRTVDAALATADFLKRDDRLRALIAVPWDLVIMDEAHVARPGTHRGEVLRALWESDGVGLMVAASAASSIGRLRDLKLTGGANARVLRRLARDLVDWDGRPVLGDAVAQVVEVLRVELSTQERDLLEATRGLLRERLAEGPQRRFLLQTLVRAAASSIFAFEGSLRRALVRANGAPDLDLEDLDAGLDAQDTTDVEVRYLLGTDELMHLISLVDLVEVDTKWGACARVLQSGLDEAGGAAVIFCDFADTAHYVAGLVAETGAPVQVATGATASGERESAHESFRRDGGVLVLTSAAAEGFSLSFVKLCIHYDMPWNPNALVQRLGRIHRIGAPPGVVRHVMFADEIIMSEALAKKLFSFQSHALGEVAEVLSDILRPQ
jgi:SNF2 family DNA or RNA helicase